MSPQCLFYVFVASQVGLEGVGTHLELEVEPRRVVVPGRLTPGQEITRTVLLRNPSHAPASYSFEWLPGGSGSSVQVQPGTGVVAPLSFKNVMLTFTAPAVRGDRECVSCVRYSAGAAQGWSCCAA